MALTHCEYAPKPLCGTAAAIARSQAASNSVFLLPDCVASPRKVADRQRCAGAAGHSRSLLCRVPDREHPNPARLFSLAAFSARAAISKNAIFHFARDFQRANVDAVTSLRI